MARTIFEGLQISDPKKFKSLMKQLDEADLNNEGLIHRSNALSLMNTLIESKRADYDPKSKSRFKDAGDLAFLQRVRDRIELSLSEEIPRLSNKQIDEMIASESAMINLICDQAVRPLLIDEPTKPLNIKNGGLLPAQRRR